MAASLLALSAVEHWLAFRHERLRGVLVVFGVARARVVERLQQHESNTNKRDEMRTPRWRLRGR